MFFYSESGQCRVKIKTLVSSNCSLWLNIFKFCRAALDQLNFPIILANTVDSHILSANKITKCGLHDEGLWMAENPWDPQNGSV